MAKLFNIHDFAVRVEALGRELAPYEVIAVEDENIVRNAIATGVLHSDLEDLSEDGKQALAGLEETAAQLVATWHAEHGQNPTPAVSEIRDPSPGTVPFVSDAQRNQVVGQAKGDAKLAALKAAGASEIEPAGQLPDPEERPEAEVERRQGSVTLQDVGEAKAELASEGDPGVVA